jgi:hypothetical protein
MATTINASTSQSGEAINAIRAVRNAIEAVNRLAEITDNMTDEQITDLFGFTGATPAAFKAAWSDTAAKMQADDDIQNIAYNIVW